MEEEMTRALVLIDRNPGDRRELAQLAREAAKDVVVIHCSDLAAARTAITNLDGLGKPFTVMTEEMAGGSFSEMLVFLRELNARQDESRPRVFVLTTQRHGDLRFGEQFRGCETRRKVNMLNGAIPFDLP